MIFFQETIHLSPIVQEKVLSIWLQKNLSLLLVTIIYYAALNIDVYTSCHIILNNDQKMTLTLLEILPKMDKKYWRCDPSTPAEGTTYAQLTKLLQVIFDLVMIIRFYSILYRLHNPSIIFLNYFRVILKMKLI